MQSLSSLYKRWWWQKKVWDLFFQEVLWLQFSGKVSDINLNANFSQLDVKNENLEKEKPANSWKSTK
jgi:hypothetical protein